MVAGESIGRGVGSAQVDLKIEKAFFGKVDDKRVDLYTLTNSNGMEVSIINYGGIVTSIKVPDKTGASGDIVLGFDNLDAYLKSHPYFGTIVGRYCNRIANAKFTLDGKEYRLAVNNGPNSLHGGVKGFDKVVWDAAVVKDKKSVGVELKYISKDGEEGFPGTLNVTVLYTLTEDNEFKITYTATTDKTTVCNLTHHSYFNLGGEGCGDILGTELMIDADKITPVGETLIPTGELKDVTGTVFDFRKPTAIGERIGADDQQLRYGNGYDHNWVLNKKGGKLTLAATAYDPKSGRMMEVFTTEPGMQLYTGNYIDGVTGKSGKTYYRHSGFALETQHYPDSPNKPLFPSVTLKPGKTYTTATIYRFSTK